MEIKERRPVRIAYIMASDVRAGVEEHVLSLVARLNRQKFEPFVVAPPRLIEAFGKDLTDLDATVLPLSVGGLMDVKNRLIFRRFLRENKIDIVNTHMFLASMKYTPVAFMSRVPVRLETSHGVDKWRLDGGWLKRNSFIVDRWFAKMQTKILAVSHGCQKGLVEIKGIRPSKIVVVQNGRSLEAFDPRKSGDARLRLRKEHDISPDEFIFGVMARLDSQKGHEFLFEAVAKIAERRRDFRVLLVGDGDRREQLQSMADRLAISDRLIFAGFQSDVVGYYATMDVKVLPSLYEGLPLCVIEAMAMEKPVIATEVDGTPEVVQNERNGLLVPPRDSAALAKAMEYALNHQEEISVMGLEGRRWVKERFSLERQIEETEALYERLLAESRWVSS